MVFSTYSYTLIYKNIPFLKLYVRHLYMFCDHDPMSKIHNKEQVHKQRTLMLMQGLASQRIDSNTRIMLSLFGGSYSILRKT